MSDTEHPRDYQLDAYNLILLSRRAQTGQTSCPTDPDGALCLGQDAVGRRDGCIRPGKGEPPLFIVDNLELVEQAIATFESRELMVGVIQGQHEKTDFAARVQIATAQTLAARIKRHRSKFELYQFGLKVIDKCHVCYASRDALAEIYPGVPLVGLSATPFSRNLGRFYTGIIQTATTNDLIERGYLTPLAVYSHDAPDMAAVPIGANGDWQAKQTGEKYTPRLIGDIIETWREQAGDLSTITFSADVARSRRMERMFRSAGVEAVHIDGYGGSDADKQRRRGSSRTSSAARSRCCATSVSQPKALTPVSPSA